MTDDPRAMRMAEKAADDLDDVLTMGAEEEFLLIDPQTGQIVPAVDDVMAALGDRLNGDLEGLVQYEFQANQIELATPPTTDLATLRDSLISIRTALCDAAESAGVRLVAIGTGTLPLDAPAVLSGNPRYVRMTEEFGAIWSTAGVCGCHVHVGVPDRELGVQVLNHLRGWLPVLHAVTANSAIADGVDTGYASWRSVLWSRWPSVGPPPHLESAAHYDEVMRDLRGAGAMLDDNMLYWFARMSTHVPTVEVRVGDVCSTVDDTVLVAALVRGLVGTVIDRVAAGQPPRHVRDWLVTAAHWRAAHDGLEGGAVDVATGRPMPAWDLLRQLVDEVTPVLDRHGDLGTVDKLLTQLRSRGSGAAQQRARFAGGSDARDVIFAAADATRP
ncbi:MAG TPA: glutamate--cysteine ligase [Micromonosporaceae bacterium]|nr:glutamate--cysteine ligase [Micromonosporaceae bacterium]